MAFCVKNLCGSFQNEGKKKEDGRREKKERNVREKKGNVVVVVLCCVIRGAAYARGVSLHMAV